MTPDEIPPAPGELGANPGDPLLPIPPGEQPARPGPVLQADPRDESRPTAIDPEQIGFTPRRAVPWLSPVLLVGTAVRVMLADLFGAYLDKRELQNALPSDLLREPPREPGADADEADKPGTELWFDYVADTGDGFHSTYSVAYLLAKDSLDVDGHHLPRGEALVLGGDQVYPTASGQQYEDRFKGPYRAALPQAETGRPAPRLYALPGNHDWYDGLTAFLRLFVRSGHGNVGGWRTRQTRSYFAIQLPHRWWLIGLDTTTGAYLDDPQLRYFMDIAALLREGDRVILCPPVPVWVTASEDKHAYDSIDYFVRKVIDPTGADVRVMIAGDLHHYARYRAAGRELIHFGGGGAYVSAAHRLPEQIQVPPPKSLVRRPSPSRTFELAATYPSKAKSRALSFGVFWRLPWRNPAFVAMLGVLQTLTMLTFANVAQRMSGAEQRLVTIPTALMLAVDFIGTIYLAMPHDSGQRRPRHWALGIGHGLAFVGLALLGTWLWLESPFFDLTWPWPLAVAALLYLPASALAASQLLGLYLVIAGWCGVNVNELFAGQGIRGYKGFLRMHIDATGELTIYPIGVDRTSHRWRATPDAPAHHPWFEPVEPLATRLIEPPIRVR